MNTATALTAFTTWQQTRGFSAATTRRRMSSLGRFALWCLPCPLDRVTPEMVEEWVGSFRTPATRHAYLSDLSAFYAWAVKRRLCKASPVAMVDGVRVPKSLPRPVDPTVIRAVIATAPDHQLRLMLALAAYAGLRRAEIAALDRGDVSLDGARPHLVVRNGKGGKDRVVPLHPDLARMLAHARRSGPVVGASMATVGRRVTAHLRACGLDASTHKLRASFATELARVTNGNVLAVADLLGHESVETSMRYVRLVEAADGKQVASMYPDAA